MSTLFDLPILQKRLLNPFLSANPHPACFQYLKSHPQLISWPHLLRDNTNEDDVLELLFHFGIINHSTLAIQGTEIFDDGCEHYVYGFDSDRGGPVVCLKSIKTMAHKEEIMTCLWQFLVRNSTPLALKIVQANITEFRDRIRRPAVKIHVMENTSSDALDFYLGEINKSTWYGFLFGEKTTEDTWYEQVFWAYCFKNENPKAMQYFKNNVMGFYATFFTPPRLYNEYHDKFNRMFGVWNLSKLFFDCMEEFEQKTTRVHTDILNAFLYHKHKEITTNPVATRFVLLHPDEFPCDSITKGLSCNCSQEAVNFLVDTHPELIEWDEFCTNTHPRAIEYMSMNRNKVNCVYLAYNTNPDALLLLSQMLQDAGTLAQLTSESMMAMLQNLAENETSEAMDILEDYFVDMEDIHRVFRYAARNTNPRLIPLYTQSVVSDDKTFDFNFAKNPIIFSRPICRYEYVLK